MFVSVHHHSQLTRRTLIDIGVARIVVGEEGTRAEHIDRLDAQVVDICHGEESHSERVDAAALGLQRLLIVDLQAHALRIHGHVELVEHEVHGARASRPLGQRVGHTIAEGFGQTRVQIALDGHTCEQAGRGIHALVVKVDVSFAWRVHDESKATRARHTRIRRACVHDELEAAARASLAHLLHVARVGVEAKAIAVLEIVVERDRVGRAQLAVEHTRDDARAVDEIAR